LVVTCNPAIGRIYRKGTGGITYLRKSIFRVSQQQALGNVVARIGEIISGVGIGLG
jgi:hypothetical protein